MSETIGFLDGLEGSYARGWAVTRGSGKAVITIRDSSGKVLARGLAGEERPDLGFLSFGRANCGFRIPVPAIGSAGELHVHADGVELIGSPLPMGPGHYDGEFRLAGGVASGWVSERTEIFAGGRVQLHDQDGALLGECDAEPHPPTAGSLLAPARFSIALLPTCFGRADLIVRASVCGVRFAEASGAMRLEGYLDMLTENRVSGWLLCPDAPSRAQEIEVYRDGALVGAGICNLPREDLRRLYPHAWRVGFDIELDPPGLCRAASLLPSSRRHRNRTV